MSTPSVTTPTDSSAHAVKERLARLEQDLIRQRKRVERTTWLTGIVGIIILIAVAGYSGYGYYAISDAIQPQKLVDAGTDMVDRNLPDLRRRLESEIVQSAPEWANAMSKQALGYLPAGRKQCEKLVLENLDEGLAQTREKTNEQFHTYIANHKDHLKKQFEELSKSPDLAETTFADLQADLEKDLGITFQADAAALLRELTAANHSFKKLRDGKDLNEGQQVKRRLWMLARAIANHEKLDLSTTGLPEVGASTAKPVSIKNPASGAKPTRKPPLVDEKGSSAPDKNKQAGKDSEKKKDAGSNSEKKNDTAADADKKKDGSSEKPDSKN